MVCVLFTSYQKPNRLRMIRIVIDEKNCTRRNTVYTCELHEQIMYIITRVMPVRGININLVRNTLFNICTYYQSAIRVS